MSNSIHFRTISGHISSRFFRKFLLRQKLLHRILREVSRAISRLQRSFPLSSEINILDLFGTFAPKISATVKNRIDNLRFESYWIACRMSLLHLESFIIQLISLDGLNRFKISSSTNKSLATLQSRTF